MKQWDKFRQKVSWEPHSHLTVWCIWDADFAFRLNDCLKGIWINIHSVRILKAVLFLSRLLQHLSLSIPSSSPRLFPSHATLLPPPLNPSLFFTPNLSLIKLNLSVSCLSWHSKVTHSIISPFYPVKFTFLHLCPDGLRFQYVLGRTEDDVCVHPRVCVKGLQHYGWLHLGGLLREHVPGLWNFHSSPPWRETAKIGREAFEGIRSTEMSLNVWCGFVYNLKVRFDDRALNNIPCFATQRETRHKKVTGLWFAVLL